MAVEQKPLMPKATAVWLVDNTALTFEQIADFCGLHPLEVKGIADEDVAKGIKGQDPVDHAASSPASRSRKPRRIPSKRLKMAPPKHKMPSVRLKRAPRYTPVSKRQDKPDAVYWIIRNHPEFADADIIKLIGTTKATIQKIRERSHWNATNIKAVDPVTLGLCSQLELDLAVSRAGAKHERAQKRAAKKGATLKPVSETPGARGDAPPTPDACRNRRRRAGAGRVQDVQRAGAGLSVTAEIAQARRSPAPPAIRNTISATSRYFSSSALACAPKKCTSSAFQHDEAEAAGDRRIEHEKRKAARPPGPRRWSPACRGWASAPCTMIR